MGSKKRSASSLEIEEQEALEQVVEKRLDKPTDNGGSPEPSTKKIKKDKKKKIKKEASEIESEDEDGDRDANLPSTSQSKKDSTASLGSLKPMERRKHRKLLDKVKHHAESGKKAVTSMEVEGSIVGNVEASSSTSSGGSGVLPEFHIGVFKDLASADVGVRENAAEALVMELQVVQKAYEKLENKEKVEGGLKLEADKDDGLSNCAPSLRYAVRRLIRGVSSSRECARQGFALGLSILIGAVPSIKIDALLKLTVDLLEVTSSMKGQEVRDSLLGRLFAYGALARSGRLLEEWMSNKNNPFVKELTSALISLATKKRYLQEPAVSVILEFIEKFPVEAVLNQVLTAPGLQEWFEGAVEGGNPDALLLALRIREKVGLDNQAFGKLLPTPYSTGRLFVAEHLSSLTNCFKESTFCQPRVHSVWPVLVNTLLPDIILQDADTTSALHHSSKKHKRSRKSGSAKEDVEKSLRCFCEVVIEGTLLPSSHDRKHLAFDILLLLLPKLPASLVNIVFSFKVVQCLMDILSTKDSWLYKVAQHFLKELSKWVEHDDGRRVAVIVALQKHSNGKFDCITRTKTVKELISELNTESGCMLFIQNLMTMFLDDGHASDEPSDQSQTTDDNSEIGSIEGKDSAGGISMSDFLKSWVIDSLPSIMKHLKLDLDAKFRVQKEILKFLAVQGLFSSSLGTEVTSFELQEKFRWPKSPISSALCRMCIEQLELLLANAQKGEGPHAVSSGLEANDLGSYFMRFFSTLCNIPSVSLYRTLDEDDQAAIKKLQAMEARLSREERNCGLSMDANKLHAMRYLLIQLLLQILLRPGELSETASELIICCKKAFGTSDLLETLGEDEPDGDSAPQLMDVLVDTMLSLLPQSSAPMRSAIEQVFKYFCIEVTEDGLVRMLRVIKKDLKPARHQDTDTEEEDDADDLLDIEEADESDEAETAGTGESDEQMDDSEAVGVVQALNEELPDDSDDSDGGMDDDAMFRMDTYLARIFKEKKNPAGGETAQSQLVLFKLRVLSLLEIYLHENSGKPQVLKVFSNLAQAFVNPNATEGSEQLSQRIWGILQKKIFKGKDYPRGEDVHLPVLETLLEKNLKLAAKPFKKKKSALNPSKKKQSASWNRYKLINSLAQSSTFWILKIIDSRGFSESKLDRVFDIFKGVLIAYFDSKKSQMKSEFLKEIFRRRPWIGQHLLGFLLEKCGDAKSKFRQVEALDLVTEILKPLASGDGNDQGTSKMLKNHLPKLCHLIAELVKNMPEKQSRRADVRKFCAKVIQILLNHNLARTFLRELGPDACAACESQLGEPFLALKKHGP